MSASAQMAAQNLIVSNEILIVNTIFMFRVEQSRIMYS